MKRPAAAFLFLLAAAPAVAQDGPGGHIAAGFARPAMEALATAARSAEAAIGELCDAPSRATLDAAQESLAGVATGWGRATVLRFGPLAAENRFERLFFWPDPRGIALRQVQGLLAEEDESAASMAGLAGKSVALQGLPALEFALHGAGSGDMAAEAGSFRCRYARAVAGNIAAVSADVLAGWRGDSAFVQSFAAPSPDGEPFRSGSEVNGEIVKALSTLLQYVRAAEILPPLGDDIDGARGKRAPLWRSELTFPLIVAQIEGARDLLNFAGYEDTMPDDRSWVASSILFELNTAIDMLRGVETPPEVAFGDEAARGRIEVANLALDHAGHLVSEQLAAALGLILGFNALDGD